MLLPAVLATGCGTAAPPFPVRDFETGRLAEVRDFCLEQVAQGEPESGALFLNGAAQMELYLGQLDEAWRHFRVAGRVMGNWQTAGGEEFAAVVGSESSKTWRGDPHEKVMNAVYLGLLYLLRGEPDNARALFRRGILNDAESGDERYRADNGLLFWLAGRMSLLMGLPDAAAGSFGKAREARRFARDHGALGQREPGILAQPAAGNLVCFVELGLAPAKIRAGSSLELAVFRPRPQRAVAAELWLDGLPLGRPELLMDVGYQATTRGGSPIDGIRKGKAVFRETSIIAGAVVLDRGLRRRDTASVITGAGLLLLGLLTRAEADVRHWETLPAAVSVLTADVAPGPHRVRVRFLDRFGRNLPDLEQEHAIEVPAGQESWFLFRDIPWSPSELP